MNDPYVFHLIIDDKATTHVCDGRSVAASELVEFAEALLFEVMRGQGPSSLSIVIKPMQKAVALEKIS